MKKYRTKSNEVEAMYFVGTWESAIEILKSFELINAMVSTSSVTPLIEIRLDMRNTLQLYQGQWLIRDQDEKYSVMSSENFHMMYEVASPESNDGSPSPVSASHQ